MRYNKEYENKMGDILERNFPNEFEKQKLLIVGRWFRADFKAKSGNLVIEVYGSIHKTEAKQKYDAERTRSLNDAGLFVWAFWNEEVTGENERAIVAEVRALTNRGIYGIVARWLDRKQVSRDDFALIKDMICTTKDGKRLLRAGVYHRVPIALKRRAKRNAARSTR